MIDRSAGGNKLPVTSQCRLLGVNRSTAYYQPRAREPEEFELIRLIDEIHLARPFLGRHRIVDELLDLGHLVNHKRVQRLMRLMGISAIYRKPRTSQPGYGVGHRVYPYLLSDVQINRPNQVWSLDITYLPMPAGFAYLVAVMDVYSRRILSIRLSNTMDSRFCVEALQDAMDQFGKPEICNTDQGAQFTANAFTSVLEDAGVKISMDGKGRWIDNVFIERFWRSLKYECVYLHSFDNLSEARELIRNYIDYYNRQRKHSSLDRQTPDDVYNAMVDSRPVPPAVHKSGAAGNSPASEHTLGP